MTCLCPQCTDHPAPTYTEEFRRECEARYLLTMRRDRREKYYRDVSLRRGLPASRQLVADVKVAYSKMGANA